MGIILSVGATDGVFKLSGQVVAVLGAGGAVKVRRKGFHKEGDEVPLAKEEVFFKGAKVFEKLKSVVHKMNKAGHGGFVSFVNGCLESSRITVSEFFGGFLAVCFDPGGVAATVADEVQAFSNKENFPCKFLGDDAWNHFVV